jgi:hypothetical protein
MMNQLMKKMIENRKKSLKGWRNLHQKRQKNRKMVKN